MKHFVGIDILKGLLLVCVFAGHLLKGSVSENLLRYVIYSFHMPLFIGISGALLTTESLTSYSFGSLIKRYFYRMLLPWLVACVIYYPVNNIPALRQGSIPWQDTLSHLLYPWYHLWFVPVLFLMVVMTWGLEKQNYMPRRIILGGGLLLAICVPTLDNLTGALVPSSMTYFFGDHRLYSYFFFFYLGYCLRNSMLLTQIPRGGALAIVVSFAILRVMDFWIEIPDILSVLVFVTLNAALIIFCIRFLLNFDILGKRLFQFMGVNSLPIYLWHILPLLVMLQLSINVRYPSVYYAFGILSFLILIGVIRLMPRTRLTNTLFFGRLVSNERSSVSDPSVILNRA